MELLDRIADQIDEWLGKYEYPLGKHYVEDARYPEALAAFEAAERWLAQQHGGDHPYVVAAIVWQANCHARMQQPAEGCTDYRRALEVVDRLGQRHHQMAVAINEWVSANCPSSDL